MSAFAFVDLMYSEPQPPLAVKARLSFVRTEDGGRQSEIRSGYRPNHNFGSPDGREFYIGQVDFGDGGIQPGESREVVIRFIAGPGLKERLHVGQAWRIQEGPKLVATGTVLEVLGEI